MIICLLGYAFYNVVTVFLAFYDNYPSSNLSYIIGYGISLMFFFGVYFSIFMISRAAVWEDADFAGATTEAYNFAAGQTFPTATASYATSPYDAMNDPNKRTSYASHSHAGPTTPAPPYGGMAYSGNGVYEQPGHSYASGQWGSGGYAPVQHMPTAYAAPMGAASRDIDQNELTGRR
ncbi:hypothetical protein ABW20_dc0103394 [Dactylellina cionopaga]|nr:hypothetical protein ABW20_dc0103394 [Dactylellina cionopaga]